MLFRALFESLPVIAAFVAMLICGRLAVYQKNPHLKLIMAWGALNSAIMVFAQSSWLWSVAIQGSLLGTEVANYTWTVHNASWAFMATYTAVTLQRRK